MPYGEDYMVGTASTDDGTIWIVNSSVLPHAELLVKTEKHGPCLNRSYFLYETIEGKIKRKGRMSSGTQ
jgi:hypothetical protein